MGWPKKVGLLFDVHRPFFSAKGWNIALDVFSYIGVDSICIGGDFADFYNISSYGKSAKVKQSFEEEILSINKGLDQLEKFDVPIAYLEGNHEFRLQKRIDENPWLFGALDCQRLFKFESRRISWHPYNTSQSVPLWGSNLLVKHVPESSGKYPAATTAERSGCSFITGHVHRAQTYYLKLFDRLVSCYSSPTLCDFENEKEVFGYIPGFHKWHLGFVVAVIDQDGTFEVDLVVIDKGKAMLWGKKFT